MLLVHLTLATGEKITATANHPLRTAEGWRDAQLIKAGGQLDLKGQTDERPQRVEVVKVQHELKRERVYNLEVANAHTFFVGEEGVWGHNAKRCKRKEFPRSLIEQTYAANPYCYYCGKRTIRCNSPHPDRFNADHYQSLANGGTNDESNIVPSCQKCNLRKGPRNGWEPF